jgi:hypothetical protein
VKSKDLLLKYPFKTDDATEDEYVRNLLSGLVSAKIPSSRFQECNSSPDDKMFKNRRIDETSDTIQISSNHVDFLTSDPSLEECRNGFDDSVLFQVIDCSPNILNMFCYSNLCCKGASWIIKA